MTYNVVFKIIFCCFSLMPRKVRLYVPKGASRKGKAEVPSESLHVASVETQTDDFQTETAAVSTQTDVVVVEFKDAAVQTDIQTAGDSSQVESTDGDDGDGQCTDGGEPAEEFSLCEGNSDEKFIPLIVKHKGVFRDVTG